MMTAQAPLGPIELEILREKTASLAHAGHELERALDALHTATSANRAERERRVRERLFAFIVQREAMGLRRHDVVYEVYPVPMHLRP